MTHRVSILEQSGVRAGILRALREDVGSGDITSRALVPARAKAGAIILAREDAVVAGGEVAKACFRAVNPRIQCQIHVKDGSWLKTGSPVMTLHGPAQCILTAERTALNYLQRLCGIATLTASYVRALQGLPTQVLDTRKTTPGLRILEKYAVVCGGGHNHRFGLYDRVLIKDNHRRFWNVAGGSLAGAVRQARARYPRALIEIEVETLAELQDALEGKPDWILLDNMSPALLRACVRTCAGRCQLEASGGVTLKSVRSMARSGVAAISIGRLTHSASAIDLSLEFL